MVGKLTWHLLVSMILLLIAGTALAADPGIELPNDPAVREFSEASDQKRGSVLIFNIYNSSPVNANNENTRINITNGNGYADAFIHLFFIDGNTCNVADAFLCLTANQTASFLASDLDPGISGYILAVATNELGVPISFDYLMGDEYVKMFTGHFANLGALAISTATDQLNVPSVNDGISAVLMFDGVNYKRLPHVLAIDNIPSRADGNDMMIILNRIGGDYSIGASRIGAFFGLLYDDAESAVSYSYIANVCQFRATISNGFPRTTPRVDTIIPTGRSGWTKLWPTGTADNRPFGGASDPIALTGIVINQNNNLKVASNAFSGGHLMHHLTLTPLVLIVIPVFPATC